MKKIDLSNVDLNKIADAELQKRFNIKLQWNKFKKEYRKKQEIQKEKTSELVSSVKSFFKSKYLGAKACKVISKYFFVIYVLLIFGMYFSFTFTYNSLAHLFKVQSQIITVEQNLESLTSSIDFLSNSSDVQARIRDRVSKMKAMAPEKPKEEDIVFLIGSLLSKHQISSPERFVWAKEKETNIISENINEFYSVNTFTFASVGSFESIQAFLKDLRQNVRVVDLKSIKMVPLADGNIEFTAMVWTYNLKSDEED